jgi:hypothetical protein
LSDSLDNWIFEPDMSQSGYGPFFKIKYGGIEMTAAAALRRKRRALVTVTDDPDFYLAGMENIPDNSPLTYLIQRGKIIGIRANPSLDDLDMRAEFLRVSGGICNGGFWE